MKKIAAIVGLVFLVSLLATGEVSSAGNAGNNNCECTTYAHSRRPDLPALGNAGQWDNNARSNHFPVVSYPVVGAIVVFEPGEQQALELGHVAYVERVINSTTFVISEKGVGRGIERCQLNTRTAHTSPRVSFILRKPAPPTSTYTPTPTRTATPTRTPTPTATLTPTVAPVIDLDQLQRCVDQGYVCMPSPVCGGETLPLTELEGAHGGSRFRIPIEREMVYAPFDGELFLFSDGTTANLSISLPDVRRSLNLEFSSEDIQLLYNVDPDRPWANTYPVRQGDPLFGYRGEYLDIQVDLIPFPHVVYEAEYPEGTVFGMPVELGSCIAVPNWW